MPLGDLSSSLSPLEPRLLLFNPLVVRDLRGWFVDELAAWLRARDLELVLRWLLFVDGLFVVPLLAVFTGVFVALVAFWVGVGICVDDTTDDEEYDDGGALRLWPACA